MNLEHEIKKIIEKTIKENKWDKLTSKEYEEYLKVTDIAKEIPYNGKTLKGEEVTDILEELGFCKRENGIIRLTEEGKKYGRYVISIHLSNDKPIVTDKGYAKYKIEVKEIIERFISENPNFVESKRDERKKRRNETRQKNKEVKKEEK